MTKDPNLLAIEKRLELLEQAQENSNEIVTSIKHAVGSLILFTGLYFLFFGSAQPLQWFYGLLATIASVIVFLIPNPTLKKYFPSKTTYSEEETAPIAFTGEEMRQTMPTVPAQEIFTQILPTIIKEEESIPEEASQEIITVQEEMQTAETNTPLVGIESNDEPTESFSLEAKIGMKWTSIIGIAALVLGIGFFIKYAIDAQWIGFGARIFLSIALGLGMVIGGYLQAGNEKYKNLGRTLMSGGFAIVYFATYASYYFIAYREALGVGELPILLILCAIVGAGMATGLRMNSKILVSEGFLLGYLTVLLSGSFSLLALAYMLLLSIALLAITYTKGWHTLTFSGMLLTYVTYFFSHTNKTYSAEEAFSFLLLFFITFFIQSTLHQRNPTKENISLYASGAVLNGLIFAALMVQEFVKLQYTNTMIGTFLLILSVLYLTQSLYFKKRNDSSYLYMSGIYLFVFFLTIASTYFTDVASIPGTMIIESTLGLFIFYKYKERPWLYSSLILAFIGYTWAIIVTCGALLTSHGLLDATTMSLIHNAFVNAAIGLALYRSNPDWKTTYAIFQGFQPEYIYHFLTYFFLYSDIYVLTRDSVLLLNGSYIALSILMLYASDSSKKYTAYVPMLTLYVLGGKTMVDISEGTQVMELPTLLSQSLLVLIYALPVALLSLHRRLKDYFEALKMHDWFFVLEVILALTLLGWHTQISALNIWYIPTLIILLLFGGSLLLLPKEDEKYNIFTGVFIALIGLRIGTTDYQAVPTKDLLGIFSLLRVLITTTFIALTTTLAYFIQKRIERKEITGSVPYALALFSIGLFLYWVARDVSSATYLQVMFFMFSSMGFLFFNTKSYQSLFHGSIAAFICGIVVLVTFLMAPVDSYLYVSFLVSIAASYLGSLLWYRSSSPLKEHLAPALVHTGSIVTMIFLALITTQYMISASWAIFALLLILVGLGIKQRVLRWHGIILFALTILKVILFDLSNLDPIYRILSFIILGVILLLTSYLYTTQREKFKDYL